MSTREDWLGWLLIGACALVVGGAFAAAAWLQAGRIELDPETLCRPDAPAAGHVVFLIDKTDPLSERRVETLTRELTEVRGALAAGERLSVFLIDERVEQHFAPLFSRCSPGQGDEANELYENPRMIQRTWNRAFGEPVERALAELVRATTAPRSPILEAIRLVAEWPPFREATHRRLIVVSDMLQNVDELTHYAPLAPFDELARGEYLQRMLPDLAGVDVQLQVIERAPEDGAPSRQGPRHVAFWDDYFAAAGASARR